MICVHVYVILVFANYTCEKMTTIRIFSLQILSPHLVQKTSIEKLEDKIPIENVPLVTFGTNKIVILLSLNFLWNSLFHRNFGGTIHESLLKKILSLCLEFISFSYVKSKQKNSTFLFSGVANGMNFVLWIFFRFF